MTARKHVETDLGHVLLDWLVRVMFSTTLLNGLIFFKSNLKPYFNACPSGASTFPCPFGSFGAALASTGGVGHAVEKKKMQGP